MSDKPCYCLGRNTIEHVANKSQLETDSVNFVAASDLWLKNPYETIKELEREVAHQTDMACQADIACRLANERLKQLQDMARDMRLHLSTDDIVRLKWCGCLVCKLCRTYDSLPPEVKGEA